MAESIRIRAVEKDGLVEALVLMPHPMETGLRRDAAGHFVAAHFITHVRVSVGPRTVLEARLSNAVSRDPLLSFRFRDARRGERISVSWTDTRGQQNTQHAVIT